MKLVRSTALAICAVTLLAQTPAPTAPMSVQQILQRMGEPYNGLASYEVPVTINAHVKLGISLPVNMTGERYFKAPDKEALRISSGVPAIAKAFQDTIASVGTPRTWPQTYNITAVTTESPQGTPLYALRGVYKKTGVKVDHVILCVDPSTFDPVEARWYYKNGATILMSIQVKPVAGRYRLPATETLDVKFPQYTGDATINYGDYVVNQPVADSVFTKPDSSH